MSLRHFARKNVVSFLSACLIFSAGIGCDTKNPPPATSNPTTAPKETDAGSASDHGEKTDLGVVTVAGNKFRVELFGQVTAGKECAFEVIAMETTADELAALNVYLWLEDESGKVTSAPAKGDSGGTAFHFHVTPLENVEPSYRVVVRVRAGDTDDRAGLPLDGHGHEHSDGPHHGLVATFAGGGLNGFLELKLHDDKGDLELWLANDEKISEPFDLPIGSEIQIEFIDVNGKTVTLRARNHDKNEDEAGNPNNRNGETHYFIYPSADGEDASWLQGKQFSSIVVVRWTSDGSAMQSEEFVLKPHVH